MSSSSAPRPILKSSSRKSSTSSTSSCDSIASSSSHCVQFSPCLSTTYLTHGSNDYNRSPISVTPNNCALPRRGCPSRKAAEQAALAQFRMESEGLTLPPLIADDGFSSSEESDSSQPPSPAYDHPAYTIPAHLLKSSRSSCPNQRRPRSSPAAYSSSSSYSISRSASAGPKVQFDGRDDIFGGF